MAKRIALEIIPGEINGHKAAKLYIEHDTGTIETFESRSNAAIQAFNGWLAEGYRAVHPIHIERKITKD